MKDLHDVETRVTSATGGQKGMKLTQPGALDPAALIELSRVAGMGAIKYDAFNFLKGYDWSLSFNAMMRHALLFWSGENIDYCTAHPDEPREHPFRDGCNGSGLSHMAHAAWMALCLVSFAMRGIGTDDRFVQAPAATDSRPTWGEWMVSIANGHRTCPELGCTDLDCADLGCAHHQAAPR